MSSLFEEEVDYLEPEPEPEPVPVRVRVKHTLPGTLVLDDGRQFVYNRWVEVSEPEAEYLLSLRYAGSPQFVRANI